MRKYMPLKQWIWGTFFLPIIGIVFTLLTLTLFFNQTYYFFFLNNNLFLLKKLNKEISELKVKNSYSFHWFKDLEVCIWDEKMSISIHNSEDCLISGFSPSEKELIRMRLLYTLLKLKHNDEYQGLNFKKLILTSYS